MTRAESVVLLLRSLVDLRLEPVSWSAQLRRQAVSGEGPSERVECGGCSGEGVRRERGVTVPCEVCGGVRGVPPEVVSRPGRGWIVVDSYTRRPIGTVGTGTSRAVRAVRCDSCGGEGAFGNGRRCSYCRGSGWLELPLDRLRAVRFGSGVVGVDGGPSLMVSALDEGFPGLGQAYRRRVASGSYEELGVALERLRSVHRDRHLLVWRVYVLGEREPEGLPDLWRCRLHLGVEFLVGEMPVVVRVPGWAARNERRRRDRLRRPVVDPPVVSVASGVAA